MPYKDPAKQLEYQREYRERAENKARKAELNRTPEAKAKQAEHRLRPEIKAREAERNRTPGAKDRAARYRARPEVRALRVERNSRYEALPEVKERRAEQHAKRHANDHRYRLARSLRNRLYDALDGNYKSGSAVELLGCTIPELITRFDTLFTEGMSWANHGKWHIDHKIPLSSFNLEDPQQLAVACHYSNLQPLWAADNLSKGAKILAA